MSRQSNQREQKSGADGRSALRFITCGSVDDGKSTLIGRLLYELGQVPDDVLAATIADTRELRLTEDIDFAFLLDGLEAEREQGITIDVAYRYFSSPRRSFIVADAPGHEHFVRNMATCASNVEYAVVLVDARRGVRTQTRRHMAILAKLGVRRFTLAVNKMDLVDYDESVFRAICAECEQLAERLGLASPTAIPLSARLGDNLVARSARMPWHHGQTLLERLESVELDSETFSAPLRLPIQIVLRPNQDFRGYSGTIASGVIAAGVDVLVQPFGARARIAQLFAADGPREQARAGEAVTFTLESETPLGRGDVVSDPETPATVDTRFMADVVWLAQDRLVPGRPYLLKLGTRLVGASVMRVEHRLNVETFVEEPAGRLEQNDIGLCSIAVGEPIVVERYRDNRTMGSFLLIDRTTNETVAAGMVARTLGRSAGVAPQALSISPEDRSRLKGHAPAVLWLTGLSGAGKSTLANALEVKLNRLGVHTILIDGDNVRQGLTRDLGFSEQDRVENIRRVGETARLMTDAGLVVLCAFISPFRAERQMVRELISPTRYVEIFVDTPLDVCLERDPKGLYKRALRGEIADFTGVSQEYERPDDADFIVSTLDMTPEEAAERLIVGLVEQNIVPDHAIGMNRQ